MNPSVKDEIRGTFHEVKGKVKEKVGQLTTGTDLETEGKVEHSAGIVETEIGSPDLEHEGIARLAYQAWQQRGCPIGTPEEDWFRAEKEMKQ